MMRKWIMTLALLAMGQVLFGQLLPERRKVRQGNREYARENYVEAESRYMGALSKNPASYEGNFNLGTALYKQGRFAEAEERFGQLSQVPYLPETWAQTLYNQGNAQVSQYKTGGDKEKLKGALEAYKQSLRINPNDQEAKFNLAYVQKLLEDEEGGGGGGNDDQNQDQDQDQNQDQQNQDQNQDQQNQDQNQDQQDQNQDQQDQDQNQDSGDPNEQQGEGQQPPPQGQMSREEAEQLLSALQNSEDQTREKVDAQQAAVVQKSGKNW
ncbi:MAG: tetratricopeptide repeat protein [Rikenellaceae bacterium]|jgi:hypothetical protein|nr:tetratricopeptide repeat protein [Rikenellaceae bacterium]